MVLFRSQRKSAGLLVVILVVLEVIFCVFVLLLVLQNQNHNNDTAALLALSLLLFLLWMGCSYDGSIFRGLWLVLSLGAYALCLLSCWECAWLSPLYAVL